MNHRAADVARLRATLAVQPSDRVSWHNLAAAEGDLGHAAEAEIAARRAIALGIDAPETRLVLARALQSLRKLDEAESMFRKAIALRPAYADAHRDLAQLTWMRTGRTEDALKKLSRALRESPADGALHLVHSSVLELPAIWRAPSPLPRAMARRAAISASAAWPKSPSAAARLCHDTGGSVAQPTWRASAQRPRRDHSLS